MNSIFKRLSLLQQVVLGLTLTLFVASSIVIGTSIYVTNKNDNKSIETIVEKSSSFFLQDIKSRINEKIQALNAIAASLNNSGSGSSKDGAVSFLLSQKGVTAAWVSTNDTLSSNKDLIQANNNSSGSISGVSLSDIKKEITTSEPYIRNLKNENRGNIAIAVPVTNGGHITGSVGIIVDSKTFLSLDTDSNQTAVLVSPSGEIAFDKQAARIGKLYSSYKVHDKEKSIIQGYSEELKGEALICYAPFSFEGSKDVWYFYFVQSVTEFRKEQFYSSLFKILFAFLFVAFSSFVLYIMLNPLVAFVAKCSKNVNRLSNGELHSLEYFVTDRTDEIGVLSHSMNDLYGKLNTITNFLHEIAKGEYTSKITSNGPDDLISNSAIDLKDSLIQYNEIEKKRQEEDKIRNWKIEGLSVLNDIIRKHNNSIKDLSVSTLREMISYIGAQQGGVFLINDDEEEQYFEMISCIAYNRDRLLNKRVNLHEGLLGRCYFEKVPIIMTEVPQNYVSITSGLGDRRPDSLIIIPLINNEKIVGAIELASFKVLTKDEIEYLQKSADAIASAIENVLITEKTKRLLDQSKQYSEEVSAQEEELRQNMEEMQASREEIDRKTTEYEMLIEQMKEEIDSLKKAQVLS